MKELARHSLLHSVVLPELGLLTHESTKADSSKGRPVLDGITVWL